MSEFPHISHAQVVDVDPIRGYVFVQFPSIQMPGLRARLLYHGAADGMRIKQTAMPVKGSWGLVTCPYGDSRNAIWMGSLLTTMLDARTGDTDPYTEYHSHWSGHFDHIDGFGNRHIYYPDGTYEAFAADTALPAVTRHAVDSSQKQQPVAYPVTDRVATKPDARPYLFNHASGTKRAISASGSLSETIEDGQTYTVTANGTTVEIDASGNTVVNSAGNTTVTSASGKTTTLTVGASTMTITNTGVTINTPQFTVNAPVIILDGALTQGTGGYAATMQGPLTVINEVTGAGILLSQHEHTGVTTGGGTTGKPVG